MSYLSKIFYLVKTDFKVGLRDASLLPEHKKVFKSFAEHALARPWRYEEETNSFMPATIDINHPDENLGWLQLPGGPLKSAVKSLRQMNLLQAHPVDNDKSSVIGLTPLGYFYACKLGVPGAVMAKPLAASADRSGFPHPPMA